MRKRRDGRRQAKPKSPLRYNIIEFVKDPALIAGDLSDHQETALRLLYNLPFSKEQKRIARECLDSNQLPRKEFHEATFICGRRSGKSDRIAANVAVYEATTGGHEKFLAPGETGHIVLIAQDKRACKVLYHYILAKLQNSPLLSQLIKSVTREEIELQNNLAISVFPCTFRSPRGYSVPVAIFDEVCFWRSEDFANPDYEIQRAVKPAMATFPRRKLIKISSPYAKLGLIYRDYSERRQRSDLLCFKAPSWKMNSSISQKYLDQEREKDPEFFDREYAANFSADIATAFNREAVEACVIQGRYELPYAKRFRYVAACDPSGGGADEFALSICHREEGKIIQDLIRGWRSKKPQNVVKEAASLIKQYNCNAVIGDRYSGEWVRQAFRENGIRYVVSELTASESFLELLPLINQGSIELLDDKKQISQLIQLERRTSRQGRDTVSHPPGGHDDRPNSLAHAAKLIAQMARQRRGYTWGRKLRSARKEAGYPVRVKTWGQVAQLSPRQAFEMICYFCGDVLRSWTPGKKQRRNTSISDDAIYWDENICCPDCAVKLKGSSTQPEPQKLQESRYVDPLQQAIKDGSAKFHRVRILGGR